MINLINLLGLLSSIEITCVVQTCAFWCILDNMVGVVHVKQILFQDCVFFGHTLRLEIEYNRYKIVEDVPYD